jgi:hypothetical protein
LPAVRAVSLREADGVASHPQSVALAHFDIGAEVDPGIEPEAPSSQLSGEIRGAGGNRYESTAAAALEKPNDRFVGRKIGRVMKTAGLGPVATAAD